MGEEPAVTSPAHSSEDLKTPRRPRRALPFEPAIRQPLALQVADNLRRQIVQGDLRPGMRLPSVQALARAFDVSPPTMYAAVVALTFAGMLRTQHGVGLFIAGTPQGADLELAIRRANRAELESMRRDIELTAGRKAALRRTERDLHLGWVALGELRIAVANEIPGPIADADLEFHSLVVRSAHNPLMTHLHRAVGRRLRPILAGSAGRIHREVPIVAAHQEILDALESRSAGRVARAIGPVLAADAVAGW